MKQNKTSLHLLFTTMQ